ncbi:discoidin domain-containing protein [Catenuloplanes sp. NPDC051500]|uniref:discoidin domain-containing protein n=1 Tax=Catenuloplanes sp. NPDC051500 TaxID=3363959 RepID=UPI0037B7DEE4
MDEPDRDPNASGAGTTSGASRLPDGPGSSGGHPGPGTSGGYPAAGASGGYPRPLAQRAIVLRGLPPYDGDPEPAEGPDLVPVRQTYQEPMLPRRPDPVREPVRDPVRETPESERSQSQELPHWPAAVVPRPVSPPPPESPTFEQAAPSVPVPMPPRWDGRDETVTLPGPVPPAVLAPAGELTEEVRVTPAAPQARPGERNRPWLMTLAVVATVGVLGAGMALVPLLNQGRAATGEPGTTEPPVLAQPPAVLPSDTASASASVTASPSPSASSSATPTPSPSASPTASVPAPTATTPTAPRTTGPAAQTGRVNSGRVNLAQGKTAGASSEENPGWGAVNAVDGDLATRWSSAVGDPQWIMVDLGELWQLDTVTLQWEAAYATAYRVEISQNGSTWTQIFSTANGGSGTALVPAGGRAGRYVRVTGTARATQYGYSLFEIQVR